MNPITPLMVLSGILSTVWLVIRANLAPGADRDRVAATARRAGEQAQTALNAQAQAANAARDALAAEQARQAQERARVDAQAKAAAAERQQAESQRLAAEAARLKQEAQARADAAEAQRRADQEARERAAAEQAAAEAEQQRQLAAAAQQREQEAARQRDAQAAEAEQRAREADQARAAAAQTAQLAAQQAAELQAAQAASVTALPPPEPEPPKPAPNTPPMPPPGASWLEKLRTGAIALQQFLLANQTASTAPGAYGYKAHPSQPVLLFQRLANSLIAQGAPGPALAEDGIFGPLTSARAKAVDVVLPPRPSAPAAAAAPRPAGPTPTPPPVPITPSGYDPLLAKSLAAKVEANLRQKIQQNKRNDYDRALMRQFQTAAGLKPDGLYGGATRGAMLYFGRTRAPQPFVQPANTIAYTPPRAAA